MSWTNLLLGLILIALTMIGWAISDMRRRGLKAELNYLIDPAVAETIEQISKAAAHHVDVAVVAEMVRQLDNNPQAVQYLKSYPAAMQRAALAHYANQLGMALQAAQKQLRRAHDGELNHVYTGGRKTAIEVAQRNVDEIRAKLDAVVAASEAA